MLATLKAVSLWCAVFPCNLSSTGIKLLVAIYILNFVFVFLVNALVLVHLLSCFPLMAICCLQYTMCWIRKIRHFSYIFVLKYKQELSTQINTERLWHGRFFSLTNVNVHMLILSSFELRHFRNINSFKVLENQIQLFKMRFDFMNLSLYIAVFVFEHTVQRWFYQQIIKKCNSIIPGTIYRLHIAYRSIKSESQFILIKK